MVLDAVLMATKYDAPATVLNLFPGVSEIAKIHTVKVQVGRWKNAYAIHEWFYQTFYTDNREDADEEVDDSTGAFDVHETEVLETLRSKVQQVLSFSSSDLEKNASKILPYPSDAWGLKYGNKYVSDLKHTEEILKTALSTPLNGWHITYEWKS